MNGEGDQRWFIRHADLIYKLLLVALVGMWVAFPPQASQPSAARPHQAAAIMEPAR